MSYDLKIQSARKIVEEHNSNSTSEINFDDFLSKLSELGGTSEEALQAASWEDLEECGLPRIMARRMTHIFRQNVDGENGKSAYVSDKKASVLSPKELVERYNPRDIKNPVGKRLKDLSDGKRFVVFHDNGRVNVEETVKLLEDIMNGMEEVKTAFVDTRPFPVYHIGERLDAYADKNPLYPTRPLRSNETCDQTGRSWSGVDMNIRQLLYIALTSSGELEINKASDAVDVMDMVMAKDCTIDTLRPRYPHASQLFDEDVKMGTLPLMKIKLGGSKSYRNKKNDPFGKNSTY